MGMKKYHRYSAGVIKSKRWKALRLEALRRDGFKCCWCGARGRLEVDHIHPVRTHPDLAYDLTNLQSLCPTCHGGKTRTEIGLPPPDPERKAWRDLLRGMRS